MSNEIRPAAAPSSPTESGRRDVEPLLDALLDAAFLVDAEGRVLACNSRGYAAAAGLMPLGAKLSEFLASPADEPWLREKLVSLFGEAHDVDEGVRWDTRLSPADDRERSVEFSISRYVPSTGGAVRPGEVLAHDGPAYLVILRDFTLRDAEEDRCRRALVELETMQRLMEVQSVELHTANLELRTARARMEAAAQAKSDFLANMSHEIRTPMTAILGYADMLLNEEGLERAPEHRRIAIETIQRNGTHLLAVINDILDLSKIEAGKMTCENIACSIFEIVDDVVDLLKFRAKEKNLELRCEFVGALPVQIHSDPTRLRQILLNLVGNAVKFTAAGSVTLRASLVEGPEPLVSFEVIDTGIGLTAEQIVQLFRPFMQADTSTTRRFGGTGLGLSICKRLAEMLGGDVGVASEPGRGSTFRVSIHPGDLAGVERRTAADARPTVSSAAKPGDYAAFAARYPQSFAEAPRTSSAVPPAESPGLQAEQDRPQAEQDRPPADPAGPSLHSRRILLAEDGPDNQRLISYLLRKAGADVTIVDNGRSAVDLALASAREGRPFDILVTDMQMPVMDGYEATRALRTEGYSGPIVALTASAMTGDREKCLAAGCDDYAVKPIDKIRLIGTIAAAIDRRSMLRCD